MAAVVTAAVAAAAAAAAVAASDVVVVCHWRWLLARCRIDPQRGIGRTHLRTE